MNTTPIDDGGSAFPHPELVQDIIVEDGHVKAHRVYHAMPGMSLHPELDFARYPSSPGYKRGGTSKTAADSMRAKVPNLQQKVLDVLFHQDLTADECAAEIGKSLLSIRPRLTELARLGKIVDTGTTRKNESGKQATVWRAV